MPDDSAPQRGDLALTVSFECIRPAAHRDAGQDHHLVSAVGRALGGEDLADHVIQQTGPEISGYRLEFVVGLSGHSRPIR
jgi:hypothetical protein